MRGRGIGTGYESGVQKKDAQIVLESDAVVHVQFTRERELL